MVYLLDLPLEILEQITSILAEEPSLSAKLLNQEPSCAFLQSDYHPLKDFSQACHKTRGLCFTSLYSAVKVDINSIGDFLAFSDANDLPRHTDSLLLYSKSSSSIEENDQPSIWPPVCQIIDSVKPSVMKAMFAPSLFTEFLPYEIHLSNQWAFKIPFQVLQLAMPRDLAQSSHTSQDAMKSQNVFQLREWTHCTFNQGSSVKAYSTYEYFYKQTPSIFLPTSPNSPLMIGLFGHLTTIDYIAVFPIDHVADFCELMECMENLRILRVQFAPTLDDKVLDDPAALGKSQPMDLWQEFESCYDTLAMYLCIAWGKGETCPDEFVSLDYANLSLCDMIDGVVDRILVGGKPGFDCDIWTREAFMENNKRLTNRG